MKRLLKQELVVRPPFCQPRSPVTPVGVHNNPDSIRNVHARAGPPRQLWQVPKSLFPSLPLLQRRCPFRDNAIRSPRFLSKSILFRATLLFTIQDWLEDTRNHFFFPPPCCYRANLEGETYRGRRSIGDKNKSKVDSRPWRRRTRDQCARNAKAARTQRPGKWIITRKWKRFWKTKVSRVNIGIHMRSRRNLDRPFSLSLETWSECWPSTLASWPTSNPFFMPSASFSFFSTKSKRSLKMESGGHRETKKPKEILRHLRTGWLMAIPRMVYRNGQPYVSSKGFLLKL